jgi:hypothetical protein
MITDVGIDPIMYANMINKNSFISFLALRVLQI